MKFLKTILITMVWLIICSPLSGQKLAKNGVSASTGLGLTKEKMLSKHLEISYQYLIANNLYTYLSYQNIQGSKSIYDVLGQPAISLVDSELAAIYQSMGDLENAPGDIYQSHSYALGIKKYIKMYPRVYAGVSLGANYNMISEARLSGYFIDEQGNLDLSDVTSSYASYHKIGAQTALELAYESHSNLDLHIKAQYLTRNSIFQLLVGMTIHIN